jgi:hypothetical protein
VNGGPRGHDPSLRWVFRSPGQRRTGNAYFASLIRQLEQVNLTFIMSLGGPIPPPNQIDKVWLTSVLKRNGALTSGEIRNIDVDSSPSTNAHIARIRIGYSADTNGDLPPSLILKTVAADLSRRSVAEADSRFVSDSEVNYYAEDYLGLADAPIPKCYAADAADDGSYSILMEDLSDTHEKDTEPNLEYGLAVATALARLHAFGWGEERIHQLGGRVPEKSKLDQYIGHARQGLDSLLEATRMDIPDSWRQAMLDIFEYHPGRMFERTKDPNGFTIVHGDINPGNIFYPIKNREWTRLHQAYGAANQRIDTNARRRVYLLDRQPFTWSLTTWLGVSDLSYLMVQFWDTRLRRNLEMSVLGEYHRHLLANGVTDYDWGQLIADYKLCVVQGLYTVTEWCIRPDDRERNRWLWRLELERTMHAFFDLGCGELWQL